MPTAEPSPHGGGEFSQFTTPSTFQIQSTNTASANVEKEFPVIPEFADTSNSNNFATNSTFTSTTECSDYDFRQAAAGIIIDENVVKKEYRDLEYHPPGKIASSPQPLDDFSDFQQSYIIPASTAPPTFGGILQPTPASTEYSANISTTADHQDHQPDLDGWSKPTIGISPTENMFASLDFIGPVSQQPKQPIDDEFTDFQSNNSKVVPPLSVPLPATSAKHPQSILLPQQTFTEPSSSGNSSSINWPAPGIDPDEMARLEAIFPASKIAHQPPLASPQRRQPSPDDEWSDFVSGTFAPQPITSIIDQTMTKHQTDDDDWSEFVSSQPKLPGPNFTAWNAAAAGPPQFGSWQTTAATGQFQSPIHHQPSPMHVPTISAVTSTIHQNGAAASQFAFGSIGLTKSTTTKAPSISSLIPDLGFSSVQYHRSARGGGGGAATKK